MRNHPTLTFPNALRLFVCYHIASWRMQQRCAAQPLAHLGKNQLTFQPKSAFFGEIGQKSRHAAPTPLI